MTTARELQQRARIKAIQNRAKAPSGGSSAFKTVDDIIRSLASGIARGGAEEFAAFAATRPEMAPEISERVESAMPPGLNTFGRLKEEVSAPSYEEALEAERARDRDIPLGIRIPGEAAGMAITTLATPAATLGGAIAQGAGSGALYGFGSGEGGAEERLKSAGVGAAFGAGGGAVGHGISRLVQPRPPADVQALTKAGVRVTPGQAVGGATKRLEEKSTSLPLVGEGIIQAQREAVESFDVAAVNKAIAPAGLSVPKAVKAGRELIEWTGDRLGQAYDDVLERMTASADDTFREDMAGLAQKAQEELTPELQKVFVKKLGNLFGLARAQGGTMSGREAKEIVSSLGREQSRLSRSPDVFQQNLADLYGAAKQAFNDSLKRSNPKLAPKLDGVDKAWANWVRIQIAAARTGSKEGIFTPAALNSAVRQADKSVRKGAFAAGRAPMQDFATAGENVIGRTYPDSGTAGRLLPYLLAGAGAGAYFDPATTAGVAGLLGAGRAAYSSPARAALAKLLVGSRPPLADPLAKSIGAAGPALAVPGLAFSGS